MERDISKNSISKFFGNEYIHPLKVDRANFSTVSDWLDDENILYVMNSSTGQDIFSFNLFTGKNKLFYSSENPIINIIANTDYQYFLVQTAPSTYESELIIVDRTGEEVFRWKVGSYELLVSWNPFSKDQLYVTTFLVDWTYQTYLIRAKEQAVLENNQSIPFIQWVDKSAIAYLKWNENEPVVSAPLYKVDLKSNKESKILDNISHFASFSNTLMTFTAVENQELAQYSFYDIDSMKKLNSFNAPLLARYSDWFIPSFDSKQNLFYTFRPYKAGNYDQYHDKYDFISYSINNGAETVILSNIDHMPIKLSPNGSLCLFGYYYENIIHVEKQQKIELVQQQ